jgi:hypothetical protein
VCVSMDVYFTVIERCSLFGWRTDGIRTLIFNPDLPSMHRSHPHLRFGKNADMMVESPQRFTHPLGVLCTSGVSRELHLDMEYSPEYCDLN